MSTYGPPGPGQPDDPYAHQGHRPPGEEPTQPQWGQPAQPQWGEPTQPQWGQPEQPRWDQPAQPQWSDPAQPHQPQWGQPAQQGQPEQPQWGQAPQPQWGSGSGYPPPPQQPYGPYAAQQPPGPPPAKKGGAGRIALIIGLVVLLVLCLCLGIGGWAVYRTAQNLPLDPEPPVAESSAPAVPTPGRTTSTPRPSRTPDDNTFSPGDCLVNDGTDDDPQLREVPCGPGTYEVLSRIPFTTDGDRCKDDPIFGAPEADANYVYDDDLDIADYVLCLKKR